VKPKFAIVIVFLLAVGVIGYFGIAGRSKKVDGALVPAVGSQNATPPPQPPPTEIEVPFEYSTEKKDWLEAAAAQFHQSNPTIRIKLIGKGSLESVAAILDGTDKPVLWSPADSLVSTLLASDWQTKNNTELFPLTGEAAPQPLLLTPLVFAVWEDRANVLLKAGGGSVTWKSIEKAVKSAKGWPGIGGKPAWGFVKLGHTDPTKSNSGLQALALMALEYFGGIAELKVEQALDPGFQDFVKNIESGVSRFETSTGTFMTDMIRFGPSKYDIALVYESLAVAQLENAQGRWGSLHIYYPSTTIWSDHPVVVLNAPWVTPAQKAAGNQFIAFLRSVPVQSTALRFGFRPAEASVPMKSSDANNPFTKMAQYGLALELPPATRPPSGPVLRNLMMMWSRITKR
jgi:hypothetical protein